jgi:hypothetical protein
VTATDRLETVYNLILGDGVVFIAGDFLARSKPPGVTSDSLSALEHAEAALPLADLTGGPMPQRE